MYFVQRSLMYFPEQVRTAPAAAGLAQAQEVLLDTADGEKVIVWHVPPRGDAPWSFISTAMAARCACASTASSASRPHGVGLVALSYRGYGGSTGTPTEAGLIEDARAAYAFAAERYPAIAHRAVGRVARHRRRGRARRREAGLAHDPGRALHLDARCRRGDYWFLPVRLLMKDQFRSDLRIER